MADIESVTTSEEGYASVSRVGEFELSIDATGGEGPTPQMVLVADYASCYLPAVRVAADRLGYDDVGTVQIEAEGDLDDNDDVQAVRFTIHVEADLDEADLDGLVERANEICHVHDALREELHADVDVYGSQF
jgi:uncharacterized OsmC-like protein